MPRPRLGLFSPQAESMFWRKVDRRDDSECWPWTAGVNKCGYGYHIVTPLRGHAHRFAYAYRHREWPADKLVRHACDNPLCCNPAHLLIGTTADNVADRVTRNRSARGERIAIARLNPDLVRAIRNSSKSGAALAREIGVSKATVNKARSRDLWRHVE